MPYKICPNCGKASYSADESPSVKWLCPYCNKDISHIQGITSLPKKKKDDDKEE